MKINLFCCGSKKHLDAAEIDEISSEATVPPTNEKKAADKPPAAAAEPIPKDITWIWYGGELPEQRVRNMIGIAATHPDFHCRWITDSPANAYKALGKIDGFSLDTKVNNIEIVPKQALYEEPVGVLTLQNLKDLEIASSMEGTGPLANHASESNIDRLLAVYKYGTRYFDVDVMLKGLEEGDWGNRIDKSKLPEEYRNLILDRKKLPDDPVARHGILLDIFQRCSEIGGITIPENVVTNSLVQAPPQSEIVGRVLKKIARNYKSMTKEDLDESLSNLVKSLTGLKNGDKHVTSTLSAMQSIAGGKWLEGGFQNAITGHLKRQAYDLGHPVCNSRCYLSMALNGTYLLGSAVEEMIKASGTDSKKTRGELAADYNLQHHFAPDTSGGWSNKIANKPSAEAEDIQPGKNRPRLPYLNPKTRSAGTALQQKFFKDETDAGNKAL
jgi:hypothetical protein